MATYNLTSSTPSSLKTGDILNCPYSGSYKSITLPKGTYKLEVWGAQGANRGSTGACGGYSVGTLSLTSNTVLNLYSGGQGTYSSTQNSSVSGGFNGGGSSHLGTCSSHNSGRYANSGGGGSDIRINSTSLYARVIVAGGGGGGKDSSTVAAGYGGGTTGGSSSTTRGGKGGSQTSGGTVASDDYTNEGATIATSGSFGLGGSQTAGVHGGGGGGGGWYGGGAAKCDGDGGGGSGYIYTSSTYSNYPSGCLLNSMYYLSNASMTSGNSSMIDPDSGSSVTGRSGNGYCRITILDIVSSLSLPVKVGGAWKDTDSCYVKVGGAWKTADSVYTKINGVWKQQ